MSHFKGPSFEVGFPKFRKNTSVLNIIVESLRKNGDEIAMVEGQTGKSATFRDFLQQSSSISAGLQGAGVTAGDYVIICCDKSITAYSLLLGVIFTGATAIFYPTPHVDIVPKLTMGFPIKAVICDPHYFEPLMKSVKMLKSQPSLIVTTDLKDKELLSLLHCKEVFQLHEVKDVRKHVPAIFFSSGTTGEPKGIQLSDWFVQHCGFCFDFGVKTFLHTSPMFWLSALMTFMSSVFQKFTVIWSNSSEPKDNLQLTQKYKIEGWFCGTGSMSRYINEPTLSNFDLSSVKLVLLGGELSVSSIYNDFTSKVLKDRAQVLNGFGSTEGGLIAIMTPGQKFKIGFCGPLCVGNEMKILDDQRRLVPVGTLGDVWLRSIVLTPGYWGRPDLDKQAFDQDGFWRTGDAGFLDENGHVHLRGRTTDLINFNGQMIAPAEVEDILMSHEAVLDAAVVGKPHPTDIQHSTAYVVLNKGFSITEQQLEKFVNGNVEDRQQLRGGVHFLPQLPRTIIGKVVRKVLREIRQWKS